MAVDAQIKQVELPGRAVDSGEHAAPCFNLQLPFKEGRQQVITDYERAYLIECLRKCAGNIASSAQHCGIDTKTFYRKMQEYGLDKRDFKRTSQMK